MTLPFSNDMQLRMDEQPSGSRQHVQRPLRSHAWTQTESKDEIRQSIHELERANRDLMEKLQNVHDIVNAVHKDTAAILNIAMPIDGPD